MKFQMTRPKLSSSLWLSQKRRLTEGCRTQYVFFVSSYLYTYKCQDWEDHIILLFFPTNIKNNYYLSPTADYEDLGFDFIHNVVVHIWLNDWWCKIIMMLSHKALRFFHWTVVDSWFQLFPPTSYWWFGCK